MYDFSMSFNNSFFMTIILVLLFYFLTKIIIQYVYSLIMFVLYILYSCTYYTCMIKSLKKINFIQILLILSQCHEDNILIR